MFAEHGYHGSRVGDIAEDAGVAHGLLYHYFASKDDVLRTIFVENWGELIGRFRAVEDSDEPAREKLEGIAKILLRTWRNDPALVTVMVREVARSPLIQGQVEEVGEAFAIIQRVIEEGQARESSGRTSTRDSRAGSSTAGSRSCSRAGCSAGFPTRRRTSPRPSGLRSSSRSVGSRSRLAA